MSDSTALRDQIAAACDALILALESSRKPTHQVLANVVRAIKESCA